MENSELLKYIEELYPFVAETDDVSKYINTLMAIRRNAFLLGVQYSENEK